jgi:hypothetical protein
MISLLLSLAFATNTGFEGLFLNGSKDPLICLKDLDGCVDVKVIRSGGSCMADAVRLSSGRVFKIPNHSVYVCKDTCRPYDMVSLGLLQYAKRTRGATKYGDMSLGAFMKLMKKKFCSYERIEEDVSEKTEK